MRPVLHPGVCALAAAVRFTCLCIAHTCGSFKSVQPGPGELRTLGKGPLFFELLLEHARLSHVFMDWWNSFARKVSVAKGFTIVLGVINFVYSGCDDIVPAQELLNVS